MSEKKIIESTELETDNTTNKNLPSQNSTLVNDNTITPDTNTPLSSRQLNTVSQYVLPLATDFTKGIALTPNVLPTEIRIGAAYEDALRLASEQPNKLTTKIARMSTIIPHFYTIDPHIDIKPATFPVDTISTFDGDQIVNYTCQGYTSEKRPKLGTLMIDFNDREYGFTVDQKSDEFFKPHKTYANIEINAVSIPYQGSFKMTDTKGTILEILEFIGYVIAGAISSYGCDYLMSRLDGLDHVSDETFEDADGMIGFSKVNGGNTLNQFFSPFERIDGPEFYAGRVSNLMTSNVALSRMEGSIPNDDYVRYPLLLPLIQFKLSNEEIRVAIQRAFPEPRPYGSLKTGIISNRSVKLSERCAVNSDIVCYELHRVFNNWLSSVRSDSVLLCELLNDTFITRAMFTDQVREFKFSRATNIHLGAYINRTDVTIFPHNAMFCRSFKVAERAPGFVTHTFSKVLNLISKGLENFPFMSFEKSTQTLTSATANMTFPGLGTALSASSLLINATSPRVLAMLASLNIMARYTNFRACPVQYDTTKNPAVFALTFLGLIVKKYLFSNLYMWNQVAWAADVHQFLMAYFPDQYGIIFNMHGFGHYLRDGTIEVVTEIIGMDKLTCPITVYTINRPPMQLGLRNNEILSQVMVALSLSNWNGIPYALLPTRAVYRVSNRQIQVPGRLYSCKTALAPRVLPIALLLIGYLNGPIRAYFDVCKKDAMVKNSIAAYDQLLKSFEKVCESFSYYFHIIYNVVVTKAALIPDLIYDDICVNAPDYNNVLCYYDSILDFDPAFPYNTPQSNGLRILIPGISDEIIGHNLTGQSVNVLMCAYNPMAVMQGMNRVSVSNLALHNTFAFLYESTDSVYIMSDYVDQLFCRQKYVECLQLVGELSINTLILNQPALTEAIQTTADQLSGVTAAIWVLLSNIVNNDNQNINSFMALQKNIFGDGLEDPRTYRLNLANLTPTDDRGRTNPILYVDPVRQHVRDNINLIVDRVIGSRYGLRKISQGLTYSMVPFRGSITWSTRHQIPGNYVTIGKSKKRNSSALDNKYEYYVVHVSLNGAVDQVMYVADPDELYKFITDSDPTVSIPAYTVVLDNPATVTSVMTEFLTEAINKCHCVIVTQQATTVPTYDECGSAEANENSVFSQEMMDMAITLGNLKFRKPKLLSTMFETGSVVSQRIIRKMLPYNPSQPIIVYKNLHTTAVGAQFIQPNFYPVVVESDDTMPAMAVRLGRPVDMLVNYPMSFTTVRNVYVAPPLSTLSVFIEPT